MPDAGCRMPDARCQIQDAGCRENLKLVDGSQFGGKEIPFNPALVIIIKWADDLILLIYKSYLTFYQGGLLFDEFFGKLIHR
jgi:hypothetical protein